MRRVFFRALARISFECFIAAIFWLLCDRDAAGLQVPELEDAIGLFQDAGEDFFRVFDGGGHDVGSCWRFSAILETARLLRKRICKPRASGGKNISR